MDEAAWDRTVRINLTGAFLMVKAALPPMIARGGGSVILIASQLGRVGAAARPAYCATKGALVQLARCWPSTTLRRASAPTRCRPARSRRAACSAVEGHGRGAPTLGPKHCWALGRPEEIARAALYLASDASAFMTGSDLLIDGGYTAV